MLSCDIDAKEGHDVAIADISGAFMQTDMDQTVYMQIDEVIAAFAAPGHSVTFLQTSSQGMSGAMWTRVMAQLAEDGTMPLLLQAAYGPTMVNGDFWEPNNRAYMVGPSVKVHQVLHTNKKQGMAAATAR
jgi:hypothetical protein